MELLCEGRCNGDKIRQIDGDIARWKRLPIKLPRGAVLEPVGDRLYADCLYTAHHATHQGRYACEVCGHERACGA